MAVEAGKGSEVKLKEVSMVQSDALLLNLLYLTLSSNHPCKLSYCIIGCLLSLEQPGISHHHQLGSLGLGRTQAGADRGFACLQTPVSGNECNQRGSAIPAQTEGHEQYFIHI